MSRELELEDAKLIARDVMQAFKHALVHGVGHYSDFDVLSLKANTQFR